MSSAKRKWWIALAAVAIAAILAIAFWPRETEPEYEGRKLSFWLRQFPDEKTEAEKAIRAIGTNALPILIKRVSYEPPRWRRIAIGVANGIPRRLGGERIADWVAQRDLWWARYQEALFGFRALGPVAAPAIPDLVHVVRNHSPFGYEAAYALPYLGKDALPPMFEMVADRGLDWRAREMVLISMRNITYRGPELAQAVPLLVGCLQETNKHVVNAAAQLMAHYGIEPNQCIPALTNTAASSLTYMRRQSIKALGDLGTQAIPALLVISNAMNDRHPGVRGEATNALWKIIAPKVLRTNAVPVDHE